MDGKDARSRLFHKTMQALVASLTAEMVGSDLDLENGVFSPAAAEEDLLAWATASDRNYSRVPLWGTSGAGHGIGGVAEIDLEAHRISERRTLALSDVLSSRTSIGELIRLLASRRFFFLLTGSELCQVVTVSDLNRLPVRVYLFTILSHLEGMLSEFILEECPEESWLELLSEPQQERVRSQFITKRAVDIDTRLIDCTTLTHKFAVIAKRPSLRERFGRSAKKEFERYVSPVNELRNRLSHGMDPIEEEGAEHLERARDANLHSGAISRRKDPAWLAGVTATIHELIGAAAGEVRGE